MPSSIPLFLLGSSGALVDLSVVERGFHHLESLGMTVLNKATASRTFQRYAGTDREKLLEIEELCTRVSNSSKSHQVNYLAMGLRGGYGLTRLLPQINFKALSAAVDRGLMLVGHSDMTALLISLYAQTGKRSFSGPMFSPDFVSTTLSEFTKNSLMSVIVNQKFQFDCNQIQPFFVKAECKGEGVLWGGNLAILTSLIGTPFFPEQNLIRDGVLFIEDVNEHPYRIERMLIQLAMAGVLDQQVAVVLGDFSEYKLSPYDNGYDLNQAIRNVQHFLKQRKKDLPFYVGLPFGHVADKLTIPVGINCSFSGSPEGFHISAKW